MPLIRLSGDGLKAPRGLMSTWEIRSHRSLAETMFEGLQDGAAFVDDAVSPRTAILCPANGFYFVCGEVQPDLVLKALPEIKRTLDAKAHLNATSQAWAAALRPHFPSSVVRIGFARRSHAAPIPELPEGLQIVPMEPSMAQKWEAPGRSGLDPWVFEVWGGAERFCRRSFGFAVVRDGRPLAFTAACAIGGDEAEVEVGTAVAWRRRGLAMAASLAFMAECASRGLSPAWSADKDNLASIALAARLGYAPIEEVIGFPLAEA